MTFWTPFWHRFSEGLRDSAKVKAGRKVMAIRRYLWSYNRVCSSKTANRYTEHQQMNRTTDLYISKAVVDYRPVIGDKSLLPQPDAPLKRGRWIFMNFILNFISFPILGRHAMPAWPADQISFFEGSRPAPPARILLWPPRADEKGAQDSDGQSRLAAKEKNCYEK